MGANHRKQSRMPRRPKISTDTNQQFAEFISDLADRVQIILVQPKYQGNIGAIARVMKNTGFSKLVIAGETRIDEEAEIRAMGGRDILSGTRFIKSLDEVDPGTFLIATSSVQTINRKRYRRIPLSVPEIWRKIRSDRNRYAIVFGREDDGLLNEEIELCHYFVTIEGNPEYPVYNISHAAAIILHSALLEFRPEIETEPLAQASEIERLVEGVTELMMDSGYPDHKMRNTVVMLRRIISRSSMTRQEYFKAMGIVKVIRNAMHHDAGEPTEEERKGKNNKYDK